MTNCGEEKEALESVTVNNESLRGNSHDQESNNSVELIRKCTTENHHDTSWDQSHYVTANFSSTDIKSASKRDSSPPLVMSLMTDASPTDRRRSNSMQTELTVPNLELIDVDLSFNKDHHVEDSSSNDNDTGRSTASKRYRLNSFDDVEEARPRKKTNCADSCTSSATDETDSKAQESSSRLDSESEISFKSIKSNYSYKTRKRRRKSDSNLIRDVLDVRRPRRFVDKSNHSEINTPGTPKREKLNRRSNRTKVWKIVDVCTWIGKKSYQSLTGLYSDILREPERNKEIGCNDVVQEVKQLQKVVAEVDQKYTRVTNNLERENEALREEMKKMITKITELENKLSQQLSGPACAPPPPPPPPLPPPPPPLPTEKKPLVRSNTLPRCGSAPPRIAGPRLTITPQDIANVKLRKTKDNPVRVKPKDAHQPLVTQDMLEATRAKLGRNRPVAASTPKQLLSELEKCLLQESSVTSLYRRRVTRGTFRSGEELRVRPYPASRCARSPLSPRSPRSNSLSQSPASPLNFPLFISNTPNK